MSAVSLRDFGICLMSQWTGEDYGVISKSDVRFLHTLNVHELKLCMNTVEHCTLQYDYSDVKNVCQVIPWYFIYVGGLASCSYSALSWSWTGYVDEKNRWTSMIYFKNNLTKNVWVSENHSSFLTFFYERMEGKEEMEKAVREGLNLDVIPCCLSRPDPGSADWTGWQQVSCTGCYSLHQDTQALTVYCQTMSLSQTAKQMGHDTSQN